MGRIKRPLTGPESADIGGFLHDNLVNMFTLPEAYIIYDAIDEGKLPITELKDRIGKVIDFIFDKEESHDA